MTVADYYRRAAGLPLLLPLLAIPPFIALGIPAEDLVFPLMEMGLRGAILFLVGSLVWGGIPYLITVVLHRRIWQEGNPSHLRLLWWTLPLRMLPILIAWITVVVPIFARLTGRTLNTAILGSASLPPLIGKTASDYGILFYIYAFTIPITLILGYSYVLLIQGTLALLQRAKKIVDLPA